MRFSVWPNPQQPWGSILDVSRHAEATGWDGIWFADHFMPNDGMPPGTDPTLECWAVLGALAAAVPRVRIGSLVCGNTYRHPAVLANQAAAVDVVSGGRLVLGLVVVAAALAVLGRRVVGAVAGHDRALVPPVVAYMAAISAMVASPVATGDARAVVGAGLFYASDTLIALDRFEQPRAWAGLAIMVTYHLGQLGLVLSLPG